MDDEVILKRRRVTQACESCRLLKSKVNIRAGATSSGLTSSCSAMVSVQSADAAMATATNVDGKTAIPTPQLPNVCHLEARK